MAIIVIYSFKFFLSLCDSRFTSWQQCRCRRVDVSSWHLSGVLGYISTLCSVRAITSPVICVDERGAGGEGQGLLTLMYWKVDVPDLCHSWWRRAITSVVTISNHYSTVYLHGTALLLLTIVITKKFVTKMYYVHIYNHLYFCNSY